MGPAGTAIFFGRFAMRVVVSLRRAGFIVPLLVLTACGGPSSGPTRAMMQNSQTSADQIEMVDVDRPVIDQLAKVKSSTLSAKFGDYRRAPKLTIGAGDGIVVSLYQMGSTGLFASNSPQSGIGSGVGSDTGARGTAIPEQVVAEDGTIEIPYVGRLKVADLTQEEVEGLIVRSLKGKSIEPQAVVQVAKNVNNTATVTGDVTQGGVIPLSPKGSRILEVIAQAGGLHAPTYETFVSLSRHHLMATVPFTRISTDPGENVFVHPGDVITVFRKPQTFTAFGATGRNAEIPFDASELNLATALGKAGGLIDSRADPSAVFVFRHEPAGFVQGMHPASKLASTESSVPVIYRIDISEPSGYVYAQSFKMREGDLVYVSNAPGAEVQKFLSMIGSAVSPAATGAAVIYTHP
jgi:polysaccharide export outer membrane protein